MGDDRPPVYYDEINGSTVLVIRASAIGGSCLWELVAAGQGVEAGPIPDSLRRAFDEGNALEPVVVKMLEDKYGLVFLSHQEEGELWLSDDVVVRYHPDGIANLGSTFLKEMALGGLFNLTLPDRSTLWPRTVVVEIKALSNALYQQAVRNGVGSVIDEYPWQLSTMMHDQQLPGLWVVYNKGLPPDDKGVRPPCADEDRLHFEYVPEPPVSLEEIQLKASLIQVGVNGEDVVTSERPCDDPNHWPCLYLHIRPEPEAMATDGTVAIHPDMQTEVDKLVKNYLFHKGQADEAAEARDRYKAEILALAPDKESKRIVTEKWHVPVVRGHTSFVAVEEMTEQDRQAYEALKRKYTRQKDKAPYLTKIKRRDI
jgi:hypothetical protein